MTGTGTPGLRCLSPIDGSLVAERSALTPDEAAGRIVRARKAQPGWSRVPLVERIRRVRAGVALLGEMNDDVVPELAMQMGRPIRYGGEFGGVSERANAMADMAETALAPIEIEDSDSFRRYILREPHGTVLVIAPWNYPYMTAINSVAPALIAGNAVVLKMATQTLLAGERLADAFHRAGIPEDIFLNLVLDHATTARLIRERSFGYVNFTGSVEAGRVIETAAAGTFTGVGLELGGKDPGYVMEDADLPVAADVLMDGALFNSGQCCCGIERIYVADTVHDEFVERAVDIARSHVLGNPLQPETTLGPMAQTRFAETVRRQVAEAVRAGAKALVDSGEFPADDGNAYLAPQVLVDADHSMRIMREESFGPVVCIVRVGSDKEAIELMNDSDYGLTASLWTVDLERAEKIGGEVETGTVFMNRCDYLDPWLCWTGRKDTGRGGALSVIGYHNLTRPKSCHLKKG